jgi:hypothetical protein
MHKVRRDRNREKERVGEVNAGRKTKHNTACLQEGDRVGGTFGKR